ncbi:hypothetical protein QYS36_17530 [Pseudomonas sp. G34]|nr:hypothetical protein [Pseudomonas sp. G34]MDQ7986746.1 hypothetical protein [Pseudomonas sp. G34]
MKSILCQAVALAPVVRVQPAAVQHFGALRVESETSGKSVPAVGNF